jgi:hypothetical protein
VRFPFLHVGKELIGEVLKKEHALLDCLKLSGVVHITGLSVIEALDEFRKLFDN